MRFVYELTNRINQDLKDLRKLAKENNTIDLYEFYHGDELIMVGTLQQISDYTRYSKSTLINYSYPAYLNSPKRGNKAPKLYRMGDSYARE